jgi:flagellar biosynthetic protein FliR
VNSLLPSISLEAFSNAWTQHVLQGAMHALVVFTLVVTRLTGLMIISPIYGHPDVPVQLRALIVAALSVLITPALLSLDASRTFARLDTNHDERLFMDEVAPSLHPQMRRLLDQAGRSEDDSLSVDDFQLPLPMPQSVLEYGWLGLIEFAVGLALGLGVHTILSGIQMSGNLIDQQIGVSLGEIFNPEFEVNASLSGQLLHQLGLMVFLIAGGHCLLVTGLLDTYQTLPVGYADVCAPVLELLRDLVYQSLVLAIQISAPIMATMAVVGIAMGFLGHTIPQVNVLVVGFPIRTLVGLILLGVSMAGAADVMGQSLPDAILQLRRVLMGLSGAGDF